MAAFSDVPSRGERNYVDEVFDSCGWGDSAGQRPNLQAHEAGEDLSWMSYDNDQATAAMPALMHNMGQLEYNQQWGRCWIDWVPPMPLLSMC